jgi:hypothetical protein
MNPGIVSHERIVVAGNVNDTCTLAAFSQELLNDVIAVLRPMPRSLQTPAIYNVADQDNRFGFVDPQKIQQEVGLGRLRAQMYVREKQGSILNSVAVVGWLCHG